MLVTTDLFDELLAEVMAQDGGGPTEFPGVIIVGGLS